MPIACASVLVIGADSSMSRALPAGGPSRMSVSTTSASSMSTIRCAVVEPTNPLPTTVTFFLLMVFLSYACVEDDCLPPARIEERFLTSPAPAQAGSDDGKKRDDDTKNIIRRRLRASCFR